jgi:hypothetical protein
MVISERRKQRRRLAAGREPGISAERRIGSKLSRTNRSYGVLLVMSYKNKCASYRHHTYGGVALVTTHKGEDLPDRTKCRGRPP